MATNFSISKYELQTLFNKVSPVVPSSAVLPILQCVRLQGNPELLTVTATKLDNSVRAQSSYIKTIDEFDIVVPFKRMKEIITKADSGDVEISVVDGVATLLSGMASWNIQLPSGETFPKIPELPFVEELDGAEFRENFGKVRKSASSDVTRPSLRMIHVANGKMTACDGIRFTQSSLSDDFPSSVSFDIPSASADLVLHITKGSEKIRVGYTDTHIALAGDFCSLVINKPTSTYPNVEQIMLRPALENKLELKFNRSELSKAIARVQINADRETEAIGMSVTSKSLTVSSKDITGNGASETIPADWPFKDRVLVVNYNLMTQLLSSTDQEDCTLFLGEDTKSRKSVILLKDDERVVSLIPQMSGNIRFF